VKFAHRLVAAERSADEPGGREAQMTKRWLIALFIAGLFGGKAFADCVPSPDTPHRSSNIFKIQ
jgi:hypothetical protein